MCPLAREKKKSHTGFNKVSEKGCAKGKEMPSDFIWTKSADVVVNEYGRKAGGKSEIMITVLTRFTDRFLWSPISVIPSFASFP